MKLRNFQYYALSLVSCKKKYVYTMCRRCNRTDAVLVLNYYLQMKTSKLKAE